LERYRLYGLYSISKRGYLYEKGWFASVNAKQAIDRHGQPIPWITYPCLSFLEERINREMDIFEYGCGNSTLWWASRVRSVISCEHNPAWYEQTRPLLPKNAELHHVALEYGGAYSQMISRYSEKFDIVFIDGRDRVNCVRNSLTAIKPAGVVILDNSDVAEYAEGISFLLANEFKSLHFTGPGPITAAVWRTTVFYRPNNCLGI
jgi:hypothetical protein